jgi:hypothetical protein
MVRYNQHDRLENSPWSRLLRITLGVMLTLVGRIPFLVHTWLLGISPIVRDACDRIDGCVFARIGHVPVLLRG